MRYHLYFWLALAGVLATAALLRFTDLDNAPPGLHHDEASNGYDAYSILKTGADRWGARWPIVLEAFGRCDHRTALYTYLVIPFQAILGPERLTLAARLPAAFFGVLTVGCLALLVARVHGRAAALWAGLMLTFSPWHLQLSRFGHEASLTPAVIVIALLLMSLGGWPFGEVSPSNASRPALRPWAMGAAGAAFSLSLYTYPSMRVFLPTLVCAGAIIYRRELIEACRAPRKRAALAVMLIVACLVAAPFVVVCVTRWDEVMARARQVSLFHHADSPLTALVQSARQYAAHFGPDWLFLRGDPYTVQSPPGLGQLSLASAPLLLAGVYVAIRDRRRDRAGVLLLAWFALHPIAAATTDAGPHALRSACGLPAFQWLAAIGCDAVVSRLGTEGRRRAVVAVAFALAIVANGAWVTWDYFGRWARDPWVAALFQQDLREAVRAIRPIADRYDRIYVSDQVNRERRWYSGEAYAVVLIALPVEPDRFHAWDKTVIDESSGFHRVTSFGPFVMTTRTEFLLADRRRFPGQRALCLARPGEFNGYRRLAVITAADGSPRFEIIETPAGEASGVNR